MPCQNHGCENTATRRVTFPAFTPGCAPFIHDYCDTHADEILREGLTFPGAREMPMLQECPQCGTDDHSWSSHPL